jgi:hypothetical protein
MGSVSRGRSRGNLAAPAQEKHLSERLSLQTPRSLGAGAVEIIYRKVEPFANHCRRLAYFFYITITRNTDLNSYLNRHYNRHLI